MAGIRWMPEQMMKGQPRLGTSSELRVNVDPSLTVWSDPSERVWFDWPRRVWFVPPGRVKFDSCSKPQALRPSALGKKGRTNRDTEMKKK